MLLLPNSSLNLSVLSPDLRVVEAHVTISTKVGWGNFGTVNVLYGPTDTKRSDIPFPFR